LGKKPVEADKPGAKPRFFNRFLQGLSEKTFFLVYFVSFVSKKTGRYLMQIPRLIFDVFK
jgi:hypothetical protein